MITEKAHKGKYDSKKARAHYTQNIYFTKNAEAERIIDFFNKHYRFSLTLFWKKKRSSRMGQINNLGEITLFVGGDSVATLLHEISHALESHYHGHTGHGPSFRKAQDEILNIFDLHAHKLITGSLPTNEYHAAQIIEKAEKSNSDILEELEGYILIKKVLDNLILDADAILNIIIKRS